MVNNPAFSEDTASVYYRISTYLLLTGQYKEAENKTKMSVDMRKSILGAEHPDTLSSMRNLASTYSKQGRTKEAEELQVAVLEANKKVLG